MTEVEVLVGKIDDLVSMLQTMKDDNTHELSDLEIQRNELQTQVDIYELQARLAILKK